MRRRDPKVAVGGGFRDDRQRAVAPAAFSAVARGWLAAESSQSGGAWRIGGASRAVPPARWSCDTPSQARRPEVRRPQGGAR
jgi:hypothetical protein